MKYQEVTNIVEHGQTGKERRRAKNAICNEQMGWY